MKEIVIINGTGGSGKDTFVEFASKYCKVVNFSSISKVKEIAKIIGWEGTKTDRDRKFLSDLKKLTTEYNDMAFNDMLENVKKFNESDNEIMFIHIREIEEIEKAVKELKAITLLIKREGISNINTNKSDANVDNYDYDYVINNTSLEEYEQEAKKFVYDLKKDKKHNNI